jgi:hypothetical protein
VLTCSTCGERIGAREVRAVAGPGDIDALVGTASRTGR